MAAHLGLLILLYVAATAQAVLAPRLAIANARPDFLLLVAVAAVLAIRGWPALVWAAVIGLVGDCLSDRPLGVGMLVVAVVVLFVQHGTGERPRSALGIAALCVVAIFAIVLARESISAVISREPLDAVRVLSGGASVAATSSAVALAVHLVWRWFHSVPTRLRPERAR